MDGLSGRQLLARFLLVTAILAAALVAGGLIALAKLDLNRQRNELGLTFSHLADATARLTLTLVGSADDRDGAIRDEMRSAWRSTAYHWTLLDMLNPKGERSGVRALAADETARRLAGWVPPHWHGFDDVALPEGLEDIWSAGHRGSAASDLLAEVLLVSSPIAHGSGPITAQEVQLALMARRAMKNTTVLAMLHRGSTAMARDFDAAAEAVRQTLRGLMVAGLATLLLILLFVLRPLARRVGRDQRALRRALREAQAADKAKAEFLATMSHELRTPLNGVLGMAALLASTELSSRQRSCVDIISSAGSALATVISDILEYSQLDRGETRLRSASFAPEDLARLPGQRLAPAAVLKGLDLMIRLDPTVPIRLEGDLDRLDHVITNLVANAVKFTVQGHVFVDISTSPAGPGLVTLRVTVADTGPGVDPARAERIFDLFEQGDQSATRRAGGIGLGLAISRSLVGLMGGRIGLEAPVSGVGASFWAEVPLRVVDPAPWIGVSPVIEGSRIALLTPSAARRAIIAEGLAAWGAAVSVAATLDMLWRSGSAREPEIVIVDDHPVQAPAADTLQILASRLPDVPVVVLCAIEGVFDHPHHRVLQKPLQPRRLRATLEAMLSERSADRLLADDAAKGEGEARPAPALTA